PPFLRANARTADQQANVIVIDEKRNAEHAISFWDGFRRLVTDDKMLPRLIGASATWFLMDAAYYGNTVSSPLILSAIGGGDTTLLHKSMTQLGIFAVFALPGYIIA